MREINYNNVYEEYLSKNTIPSDKEGLDNYLDKNDVVEATVSLKFIVKSRNYKTKEGIKKKLYFKPLINKDLKINELDNIRYLCNGFPEKK